MAQDILKFSQLNTGNLDKLNAMLTELYEGAGGSEAQFAWFDGSSGTVVKSTEAGWGIVRNSMGQYDITFPDAATAPLNQKLILSSASVEGNTVHLCITDMFDVTATACSIRSYRLETHVALDSNFTITRTLID